MQIKLFLLFKPNLWSLVFLMGLFLLPTQTTKAQVPCEGPYFLIVNDHDTGIHVYSYDNPSISYPNSCLTGVSAGGGEGVSINYGNSLVYIAEFNGTVSVYDAISGTLAFTFGTGDGSALDVALSNDGLYLYVASSNGLYVYDATNGNLIDSLPKSAIHNYELWGVDVNPVTGNVYVTDGWAGATTTHITIISPQPTLTVINTLVTETTTSSSNSQPYNDFAGIEFAADGSFWVIRQKDSFGGSDFVLHYDANGNLIKTCDVGNANPPGLGGSGGGDGNAYDLAIGADGNLLVTSFGSQTQVYSVDSATCASTPFLTNAGYNQAKNIALGCVEMICEPCAVEITNSGNTTICAGSNTGVTFNVINAFDTHTITITPNAPYSTTDTDRSDGITYTLDAQPATTTTYTIQVNSNGCMKSTDVTVTTNPCQDLSLTKTVSTPIAAVGDEVTFTLVVNNDGATQATGVQVTDALPAGLVLSTATTPVASQGTFDPATGIWDIGTIAAATTSVSLNITVIAAEGTYLNKAEITNMNEPDSDSTPNNNNTAEDDQAHACFSVPIKYCTNQTININVNAEAGYSSYQWYQYNTTTAQYEAIANATNSTYIITAVGSYIYTVNGGVPNQTCTNQLCCPIVVTQENCCAPSKCIAISIAKN